jgi:hypothetical protein
MPISAYSPSFSNQQIPDPLHDWNLRSPPNKEEEAGFPHYLAKNLSECKVNGSNFASPDISEVDYVSDGRKLNATMWLSSLFKEPIRKDRYGDYLVIGAYHLTKYTTLEKVLNDSIADSQKYHTNFKLISHNTNATFAGRRAYTFEGTEVSEKRKIPVSVIEIGTVVNGSKVYYLSFYVERDKFSSYFPKVKSIINSFRIDNFSIYKDNNSGISIQYPSEWSEVNGDPSDFRSILGTNYNNSIYLLSPYESDSDLFSENLYLRVEDLPATTHNVSPDEYLKEDTAIKQEYQNMTDINIIQSGNTTFASKPAYKIVSTYKSNRTDYDQLEIAAINHNKVYYLSYTSEKAKYHKYLPTIEKIIGSIRTQSGQDLISKSIVNQLTTAAAAAPAHYIAYKHSIDGINVQYPANWKKAEEENYYFYLYPPLEDGTWIGKAYQMAIDVTSGYNQRWDYDVALIWNSDNQTWTKLVSLRQAQIESVLAKDQLRFGKILENKGNYTGFFNTQNNYVDLSLDLGLLNYPQQYNVISVAYDNYLMNGRLCPLIDVTDIVPFPPPEFNITASPSSLVLRPGDEKTIELNVKSVNSKIDSQVSFSTGNVKGIALNFIPKTVSLTSSGSTSSMLDVKVPRNATPGLYPLNINELISFSPLVVSSRTKEIFNNSKTVDINKASSLSMTVLPPLTLEDNFKNIYNSWIIPLSGLWTLVAGIAAVTVPLIVRMYRKKK